MREGKRAKVYLAACGFSHFLLSARRASSRARCSSSALLSQRFSSSFSSLFVVQRGARRVLHNRATAHAQARDARAPARSSQPATSQQPANHLIGRLFNDKSPHLASSCVPHVVRTAMRPTRQSPPRALLSTQSTFNISSRGACFLPFLVFANPLGRHVGRFPRSSFFFLSSLPSFVVIPFSRLNRLILLRRDAATKSIASRHRAHRQQCAALWTPSLTHFLLLCSAEYWVLTRQAGRRNAR